MGLEAVEFSQKMESYEDEVQGQNSTLCATVEVGHNKAEVDNINSKRTGASDSDETFEDALNCNANDNVQQNLIWQVQVLLRRSKLYQKIDESVKVSQSTLPNVYHNLPQTAENDDAVSGLHRDAAVNNLRFLNIFYGYSSTTFALAVNLLDRVLGKVKAHPKYLSCIATSCFFIAAKTQEENVFIPNSMELVKLSQCGGTSTELLRMEQLVLDKVQWQQIHIADTVTPLTFLQYFFAVLADMDHRMAHLTVLNSLVAKLEVLLCQFEFTKYRAETLALSLLSCVLQDMGILSDPQQFASVVELQCFCQVTDMEFLQCRSMVMDYLVLYGSQPSKLPRLQLNWTVSRRTLNKMKPSTKVLLDLETIFEDEGDDNDAGPFDSENSDGEVEKLKYMRSGTYPPSSNANLASLQFAGAQWTYTSPVSEKPRPVSYPNPLHGVLRPSPLDLGLDNKQCGFTITGQDLLSPPMSPVEPPAAADVMVRWAVPTGVAPPPQSLGLAKTTTPILANGSCKN